MSDWWNPPNKADHIIYWLCLPLFTFKDRHNQPYVLNDQSLNNPDAFYIPPGTASFPGASEESVARIQAIQMIKAERLIPCKCMCSADKMNRPFRLSDLGLRLILYHFYRSFNVFSELNDPNAEYGLFKEEVSRLINVSIE